MSTANNEVPIHARAGHQHEVPMPGPAVGNCEVMMMMMFPLMVAYLIRVLRHVNHDHKLKRGLNNSFDSNPDNYPSLRLFLGKSPA